MYSNVIACFSVCDIISFEINFKVKINLIKITDISKKFREKI